MLDIRLTLDPSQLAPIHAQLSRIEAGVQGQGSGKPGGVTPTQLADLQQVSLMLQTVINTITAQDH